MTVSEILSNIPLWIKTGIANNVKSSKVRTLLTWMAFRLNIIETGRLIVFKASGNVSNEQEPGDRVSGVIENTFVKDAIYLGGNISLLVSYALVNDPGYVANNPTENTYADIPTMLADQANQTEKFNQQVDDDGNGNKALYYYLGTTNGTIDDYLLLSDFESSLSNYTQKGGYNGTSQDLKEDLENQIANAGGGDMLAATYDPNNKNADAFNMANMDESANAKVLTASERAKLAFIAITQAVDLDDLENKVNALETTLNSDDPALDILQEIVDFIKINKTNLDQIQLLLQSDDTAYDTLQEIVDALKDAETKLATIRPRTPIIATGVSGTYNIDLALSIHWKITMTGATSFTFSNFDKALGETTSIQFTGAVPSLNLTKVNVTPSSQDPDATKRNLAVVNVVVTTPGSEIVDWQNTVMTA